MLVSAQDNNLCLQSLHAQLNIEHTLVRQVSPVWHPVVSLWTIHLMPRQIKVSNLACILHLSNFGQCSIDLLWNSWFKMWIQKNKRKSYNNVHFCATAITEGFRELWKWAPSVHVSACVRSCVCQDVVNAISKEQLNRSWGDFISGLI
jgi:hypothetical protein